MRKFGWILVLLWCSSALAAAPPWLRELASAATPKYSAETAAVILLDEQTTTVKDNGEVVYTIRRAYRLLRPQAHALGDVKVFFDNETRITYLKAWCIPASGKEYEVKESDAIESANFGALYSDNHVKVLTIPAADPGNVIGYEYEQKGRPAVYQSSFYFQDPLPVRRARFVLNLPPQWDVSAAWVNYLSRDPQKATDSQWTWEVDEVPALEPERSMPPWEGVGGRLLVNYFRKDGASHRTWADIAKWYGALAAGRRTATPAIKNKVAELTAGVPTLEAKLRTLARFAQRDVRYVAIEIGIGGFQPHPAADIFTNRYGDCKDKATLLSTMLQEIGLESYYLVVNTDRGVVLKDIPSVSSFNHVILAVRLPKELAAVPTLFLTYDHPQLGKLLLFDPTDPDTPVGYLPTSLQGDYGLLVTNDGGELISIPLLPPGVNRLIRSANVTLTLPGTLEGALQETRTGAFAVERRAGLLAAAETDRKKQVELQLTSAMTGAVLRNFSFEGLDDAAPGLVLKLQFATESYAKTAGNLLLVRPRIMGVKASNVMESDKPRKFPVLFDGTSLQSDSYEITLPAAYEVDELPSPVEVDFGFAAYRSKLEFKDRLLRYTRDFEIKQVVVPVDKLADLKKLYRIIVADERNNVVLKRRF